MGGCLMTDDAKRNEARINAAIEAMRPALDAASQAAHDLASGEDKEDAYYTRLEDIGLLNIVAVRICPQGAVSPGCGGRLAVRHAPRRRANGRGSTLGQITTWGWGMPIYDKNAPLLMSADTFPCRSHRSGSVRPRFRSGTYHH